MNDYRIGDLARATDTGVETIRWRRSWDRPSA